MLVAVEVEKKSRQNQDFFGDKGKKIVICDF